MARPTRGIALTAAALLVGTVTGAGAAGTAQAAAFDPATLCPSAAPSAQELVTVLDGLSAAAVKKSADTGIHVWVYDGFLNTSEESTQNSFSADPSTGRAMRSWYRPGTDGTRGHRWERYVDVKAHRSYRRFGQDYDRELRDDAALTGLGRSDRSRALWLVTSTSQPTGWPYRDYLDITGSARAALNNSGGYSFTCTVDGATAHVVATGPDGERTYEVTVDSSGAPVEIKEVDIEESFETRATAQYARPTLTPPRAGDVISASTYRKAAVRGLTEKLRHDVLLGARPEVKRAGTLSKRLKVLQRVSVQENRRLLRNYNSAGTPPVTSTAKQLKTGKRYTIRYGGATGYLRFSIKGRSIVTNTAFR